MTLERFDTTQEIDYTKHPSYAPFMDRVGGPDKMIPKAHGLSQMMRLKYHAIAFEFGADTEFDEETGKLVQEIDGFYGYYSGVEKTYTSGTVATEEATPAGVFFKTAVPKPDVIAELTEMFTHEFEDAQKAAASSPIAADGLDTYGGLEGFRKWLGTDIASWYVFGMKDEIFTHKRREKEKKQSFFVIR
jgi:hypothetical protein